MPRFILLLIALFALLACRVNDQRNIDIPEGLASKTLMEFAKQADIEIVFDTSSIQAIQTSSVSGKMSPRSAISTMLAGTPLRFEEDPQTGAFAITLQVDQRNPTAFE